MSKKTVLISGGTSGIGRASVRALLKEGFRVATFSSSKEKCEALKKELAGLFDAEMFMVMHGSVSNENDVMWITEETMVAFERIDIVINNAGIGYFSECDDFDADAVRKMFEVNVLGVALLNKFVVPHMKDAGSGLILNVASVSGRRVSATSELYAATKFAVMGYTEGLRKEVAEHGIRVSTLLPGMIETPFFSDEEWGRRKKLYGFTPNLLKDTDVARAVVFMCTQPEHAFIEELVIMPFDKRM